MICLNCNVDFDEDNFSFCPECGTEYLLMENKEKFYPWILVYTTNTDLDAQMFKANLSGADIPCNILSQVDSSRMFNVGDMAIVKIYVPSNYYDIAKTIIQDIENNSNDFDMEF